MTWISVSNALAAAKYYRLQHTCVKCGQEHSAECKKAKDDPSTCGNCGEAHTALYQSCRVYIEVKICLNVSGKPPKPTITANPEARGYNSQKDCR